MKIAFLGTGLLGNKMLERLTSYEWKLLKLKISVYNRSTEKNAKYDRLLVQIISDPIDAMENADVIIIMLSEFFEIKEALFKDGYNKFSGKDVIMMSTISPEESCQIEERIKSYGGNYLEAPVLGSIVHIKENSLLILVGGEKKLSEKYKPLIELLGEYKYFGKVGDASSVKLLFNQLIVTETAVILMSLGYLLNKGIDINSFMKILRMSILHSLTFDKKLNDYVEDNYENPDFPLKDMLKDVKLIESDFAQEGINNSVLKSIIQLLKEGINKEPGELDYSAIFKTINHDENNQNNK